MTQSATKTQEEREDAIRQEFYRALEAYLGDIGGDDWRLRGRVNVAVRLLAQQAKKMPGRFDALFERMMKLLRKGW